MLKVQLKATSDSRWCVHTIEAQEDLHIGVLTYNGDKSWTCELQDSEGNSYTNRFTADGAEEARLECQRQANDCTGLKELHDQLMEKARRRDNPTKMKQAPEEVLEFLMQQCLIGMAGAAERMNLQAMHVELLAKFVTFCIATDIPVEKQDSCLEDVFGLMRAELVLARERLEAHKAHAGGPGGMIGEILKSLGGGGGKVVTINMSDLMRMGGDDSDEDDSSSKKGKHSHHH